MKKLLGNKESIKFQFNLSVDHLYDFKNSTIMNKPGPDEDIFYAVRKSFIILN